MSPAGILTLRLESPTSSQNNGVYWSLPLAHFRTYGKSYHATRELAGAESRISMEELFLVALGTIFGKWQVPRRDYQQVARLVSLICRSSQLQVAENDQTRSRHKNHEHNYNRGRWLERLAKAADVLGQPACQTKETTDRLVGFGCRRGWKFLGGSSNSVSLFGLRNLHRLIRHLEVEDRLSLLRSIAKDVNEEENTLLIRYCQDDSSSPEEYHAFATAFPIQDHSRKRTHERTTKFGRSHCRWLPPGKMCSSSENITHLEQNEIISDTAAGKLHWKHLTNSFLPFLANANGTELPPYYTSGAQYGFKKTTFEFVCGDPMRAAIFKVQGNEVKPITDVSIDTLEAILPKSTFDWGLFLQELELSPIERDTINSLIALDATASIYDFLPGSTISTSLVMQPLLEAPWVPQELVRRTVSPSPLPLALLNHLPASSCSKPEMRKLIPRISKMS